MLEVFQAYRASSVVAVEFDCLFLGNLCLFLSLGDSVEGTSDLVHFVDGSLLRRVQGRLHLHLCWCAVGRWATYGPSRTSGECRGHLG